MRLSILFFALCSALDEAVTFRNVLLGGEEFNANVSWLLGLSSLLYPICDIALILVFWIVDRVLGGPRKLWLVWSAAGVARLVCFAFSLFL